MKQVSCCPYCGVENVMFAGLVASVEVRSNTELVAPFTCGNSHVFFVPLERVAQRLRLATELTGQQRNALMYLLQVFRHQVGVSPGGLYTGIPQTFCKGKPEAPRLR
jgi:hypothetical protein